MDDHGPSSLIVLALGARVGGWRLAANSDGEILRMRRWRWRRGGQTLMGGNVLSQARKRQTDLSELLALQGRQVLSMWSSIR